MNRRFFALCVALLVLAISLSLRGPGPSIPADENPSVSQKLLPSPSTVNFAPSQLDPQLQADGFSSSTRKLALALDQGSPLRLRVPGREDRRFLTRPRRLLAQNFQATLGTERTNFIDAGFRSYEGSEFGGKGRLGLSIVGGSAYAIISEEDGRETLLRSDSTGHTQWLERPVQHITCAMGEEAGKPIAISRADSAPLAEAAWEQAALVEWEPEILASNGADPETGRLDKYVEPIPSANNYDASLRDMMHIIALDKSVTGPNNTERLTQVASEYLAKAANMASIYENQLGVRLLIVELIMTPDDAKFQDIPNSLNNYNTWLNRYRPFRTYNWSTSTKFGNGAFTGGTIGVAWVSAVGSDQGVNVCSRGYGVSLEAHENGHNLGSSHSNGGIMNASFTNSRDFFTDVTTGDTAAMQIYRGSRNRLPGLAPMRNPEEIPWAKDDNTNSAIGQSADINVLRNDLKEVRNGQTNSQISVEEVSRVMPSNAGSVVISDGQLRFLPATGYEGIAWFSYTLRGNVGNGGLGWLHKADVAVEVGQWDENSLQLRLAPGQSFSFRPSGSADPVVLSQPAHARVDLGRDDRKLFVIRVNADAQGSDFFRFERAGITSTVEISYQADYLQLQPDVFVYDNAQDKLLLNPLANDQAAGIRNAAPINPVVGLGTVNGETAGQELLPGAARLISADLLTPDKGTLSVVKRPFIINSKRADLETGLMSFTPNQGAVGVAQIRYIVEDATGQKQSSAVSIVLPLCRITTPSAKEVNIPAGHGLLLGGQLFGGKAEPPLSGVVSPKWSVVSAPIGAEVSFDQSDKASTGASFSHEGDYVLRLTGADAGYATHDEIRLTVTAAEAPSANLEAFWRFEDDDLGGHLNDSSGKSRLANAVGIQARATGIGAGRALNFDGTRSYVDLSGNAADFRAWNVGSVSLWFQTDASTNRPLFSIGSESNRYWTLGLNGGRLSIIAAQPNSPAAKVLSAPLTSNDSQWHHALVTASGSNTKLYLDGKLQTQGHLPFWNQLSSANAAAIGRQALGGDASYFRGLIDEVRLYSRVLNEDEIRSLTQERGVSGASISWKAERPIVGAKQFALSLLQPRLSGEARASWEVVNGPASAELANAARMDALITFPSEGDYTLRLLANNPVATTFRDLKIHHSATGATAPFTFGLPDLVLPRIATEKRIDLSGAFGDADDPITSLVFSLPPPITDTLFQANIEGQELVLRSGEIAGTGEIIVRASDPASGFVDAPFRVMIADGKPLIPSQSFSVLEGTPAGVEVGQILAADPEKRAVVYSLLEGNELGAFSLDRVTGKLSVASPFALDFEARPNFSLLVRVAEAANSNSFTTAKIAIKLEDMNEAPVFLDQNFTVTTGAANGLTIDTLSAADPEGTPLEFSVISGNEDGALNVNSDGRIIIANASAFDIERRPRYVLTVRARETQAGEGLSALATVRVTLEGQYIKANSQGRWLAATNDVNSGTWRAREFEDGTWKAGSVSIGYDRGTDYDSLITTNVEADLYNKTGSLYLRIPFLISDPKAVGRLTLRMKYDDGFAAWLNGATTVSDLAPDAITWSAVAKGARNEDEAKIFRDFDLTPFLGSLRAGDNVLAIQGFNSRRDSNDLLFVPELVWSPAGSALYPNPPLVENRAASLVESNSANLEGEVKHEGGATPKLTVYYGRVDGGTNPLAWEHRTEAVGEGTARGARVTGLFPNQRYYFRFAGENAGGRGWAATTSEFTTLPAPLRPNFATWAETYPGIGDSAQDFDEDGWSNLLEYAFGGNPTVKDVLPLNSLFQSDGSAKISFQRRKDHAARGLRFLVESSPNLQPGSWSVQETTLASEPLPLGENSEVVTLRLEAAEGEKRFLRIRVELNELN